MPKLACCKCGVSLVPENNGVYVIELFTKEEIPYKIWHADRWKCPICGKEIMAGYGQNPISEHYLPDFNNRLGYALKNDHIVVRELCYALEERGLKNDQICS